MRTERTDSSTYIAFKDGTSSASERPVVETTAPSDSMASLMANWAIVVPSVRVPPAGVEQKAIKPRSRRAV